MLEIKNITDLAPYLSDELKAGSLIESVRWPNGVTCPHCGHDTVYETKTPNPKRKQWKCGGCRKKFSVTTGSVFEGSHIHLGKWIYALFLMCSAKKGVSANQLSRELGITYRSAWFMCHRIRYAMDNQPLAGMLGGIVEVDETYVGGKARKIRGRGARKKTAVVALLERGGKAKSFKVDDVTGRTLKGLVRENVEVTSHIMTDAFASYKGLHKEFAHHATVDHNREYVRGICHTNFAESYFSLLKRGIMGSFHHVSAHHLHRYLAEFNHRWNSRHDTDVSRMALVIGQSAGKRLKYREPRRPAQ